jgi:hypothetical protein
MKIETSDVLLSKKNPSVTTHPFPYFQIKNFLPDDFYRQLLAEYPSTSMFNNRLLEGKRVMSAEAQDQVVMASPAWSSLIEHMGSQEFLDDMFSVLRPSLRATRGWLGSRRLVKHPKGKTSIGDWLKGHPTRVDFEFSRLPQGALLTPHTDKWTKVLSLLLYLPPPGWRKEYGGSTELYAPKSKAHIRNWSNRHLDFDKVDVIFQADYSPNTLFGFVKTRDSFHGVSPILCPDGMERLTFNINYKVPQEFVSTVPARAIASYWRRSEARYFRDVPDMKETHRVLRLNQIKPYFEAGDSDEDIARKLEIVPEIVRQYREHYDAERTPAPATNAV